MYDINTCTVVKEYTRASIKHIDYNHRRKEVIVAFYTDSDEEDQEDENIRDRLKLKYRSMNIEGEF